MTDHRHAQTEDGGANHNGLATAESVEEERRDKTAENKNGDDTDENHGEVVADVDIDLDVDGDVVPVWRSVSHLSITNDFVFGSTGLHGEVDAAKLVRELQPAL